MLKKDDSKAAANDESIIGGVSMIHSDVGLKNCSLLVMENDKEDQSMVESVDRNTVDQFLDEEPPQLQHN